MPVVISIDEMICIRRDLLGVMHYLGTEAGNSLLLNVWARIKQAREAILDKDLSHLGYRSFWR